jgi:hypothetical protein
MPILEIVQVHCLALSLLILEIVQIHCLALSLLILEIVQVHLSLLVLEIVHVHCLVVFKYVWEVSYCFIANGGHSNVDITGPRVRFGYGQASW